jgi:hypothetical protein
MVETVDGWTKKSIELPPGVHNQVVKRALDLRSGRTGLVKHVWTVAACLVLQLEDDLLRRAAEACRRCFDQNMSASEVGDQIKRIVAAAAAEDVEEVAQSAQNNAETPGSKRRQRKSA